MVLKILLVCLLQLVPYRKGVVKVNKSFKSNGFTLIEVLVSLVILAISLLALAGLMNTTTKNNAFGGRLTEAATFAQDKLEELRAMSWESISGNSDKVTGSTGIIYDRSWEVGETDPKNDHLKKIEVTIRWSDVTSHSLKFTSVLSK